MEMLIDVFTDAALDCIKMLPFLFLAFLLIEALEHYSSDFTKKLMIKVDKAGPVVGAVVGCCLLYTSPSPRDLSTSRMPSSA